MAISVLIKQHDDFLEVLVGGNHDMQEAVDRFPHVLAVCRLTRITRVLINYRELQGVPAATEKIIYAFGVMDHYREHLSSCGMKLRVAYVGGALQVSSYEPGLQIARDEGLPFELFTDVEQARKWLGSDPS